MFCNLYQKVGNVGLSKKKIEDTVKTVLNFLKKKDAEVSVHLIGDRKIKKINADYRGKNKVTDVLAFAMQEGKQMDDKDLGDIFISVPQVKRQSKKQKISYEEELVRMLVHGVLHLNGYDHMEEKDEKKMFSLQEKLVKKLIHTNYE